MLADVDLKLARSHVFAHRFDLRRVLPGKPFEPTGMRCDIMDAKRPPEADIRFLSPLLCTGPLRPRGVGVVV